MDQHQRQAAMTTGTSVGFAGSLVVIIVDVLTFYRVSFPSDFSPALVVVIGVLIGYYLHLTGYYRDPSASVPAPAPAPAVHSEGTVVVAPTVPLVTAVPGMKPFVSSIVTFFLVMIAAHSLSSSTALSRQESVSASNVASDTATAVVKIPESPQTTVFPELSLAPDPPPLSLSETTTFIFDCGGTRIVNPRDLPKPCPQPRARN